jgi:hypothetical protein
VNGAFSRAARVTTATGMPPVADTSGPGLSYSPLPGLPTKTTTPRPRGNPGRVSGGRRPGLIVNGNHSPRPASFRSLTKARAGNAIRLTDQTTQKGVPAQQTHQSGRLSCR